MSHYSPESISENTAVASERNRQQSSTPNGYQGSSAHQEYKREQGYYWSFERDQWVHIEDDKAEKRAKELVEHKALSTPDLPWMPWVDNAVKLVVPTHHTSKPLTGGSSDYYKLLLQSGNTVECMEIIESLNLSYSEANILKAIWRQAAARQGNGKAGTELKYDREKLVYFSNRLLLEVLA